MMGNATSALQAFSLSSERKIKDLRRNGRKLAGRSYECELILHVCVYCFIFGPLQLCSGHLLICLLEESIENCNS